MQLSRKRSHMADHLSSSSSNHQPQRRRTRQASGTPDRRFLEEQLHLLQHTHTYRSPDDEADMETNSITSPLLWRQPRPSLPLPRRTEKSWAMSSLLECCPMSPSPVCSPIISHVSNACSHASNAYSHISNVRSHMSNVNTDDAVFVTAKSSCHIEADTRRSITSDEIQEEETTIRPPEIFSQPQLQTTSRVQTPYRQPHNMQTRRSITSDEIQEEETTIRPPEIFSQPQLQTTSQVQTPYRRPHNMQNSRAGRFGNQGTLHRAVPARHISYRLNVHEVGGLPEARTNSRQLNTVPSQQPYVGAWNRRSVEGSYMADDENSLTSRPQELGRSRLARLGGGQMEVKLKALKEEHRMKLLTRLRKQEDAIDNWERQQILKVKEKMRKTEIKLELERRTALKKAKKDIEKAQLTAAKKKIQEQNETAKKLTCSNKPVEKLSCVGKVLWKLACF